MKKKILLILVILVLFISAGIIYLNKVYLPTKIKSLIIRGLEEKTKAKVNLESVQFNIFKGLVLKKVIIYDDKQEIISVKEASCSIFFLPIFQKQIIIPSLKIKSAQVLLKRRQDNTFNLMEIFYPKPVAQEQTEKVTSATPSAAAPKHKGLFGVPLSAAKKGLGIHVYRITVSNSSIRFQDETFQPAFSKDMVNLNLKAYLSLPASVKFSFKSDVLASPAIKINAQGEFRIPQRQLTAKVSIQDFSASEFSQYYQNLAINIPEGLSNALVNLKMQDDILEAAAIMQNKNIAIAKGKVLARLNADVQVNLKYGLKNKQLEFAGKVTTNNSSISGLEFVEDVKNVNGELTFSNSGIYSDKLVANIWGVPVQAKASLTDFNNPSIAIDILSLLNLTCAQNILKDKLKFLLPGEMQGKGNLSLSIRSKITPGSPLEISGSFDVIKGVLRLKKISSPFEDINGRLEFGPDQIKWRELNFKYLGVDYKTEGALNDFKSPQVHLGLASKDMLLDSDFAIVNKIIDLAKFKGKYINSEFSLAGKINAKDPDNLETDLNGDLDIDLRDIKWPLKKFKDKIEQLKPQGLVHAKVNLNGNINNVKSCIAQAKLTSPAISIYGLNAGDFSLDYLQAGGIIDIASMHLSLYDGAIDGKASMNLNSDNLPYWITLNIEGLKLEKLKLDTKAKEKDIVGTIKADAKINGFSADLAKLSGAGNIAITGGKLWQLNLFKGLGSLVFAKDFANIIFEEGDCSFFIKDKYLFTDNLKLKSNIAELTGSVRIGFDNSIDAALDVKILDEMAPLSGTFKDVTTALMGQAGRFGVIKISGTINDPKYKFKPAVVDIIKGLKDAFFGK